MQYYYQYRGWVFNATGFLVISSWMEQVFDGRLYVTICA